MSAERNALAGAASDGSVVGSHAVTYRLSSRPMRATACCDKCVGQCLSRMRGNLHVRLCVQERLMCPAGDRPAGVRIGSPVAGRAGRRETEGAEAPRQPHPWDVCKWSGRNECEREVAPKMSSPGGRARNREGEGSTARRKPIDATGCSGGVVSDGTSIRIHQATGEALLVPT